MVKSTALGQFLDHRIVFGSKNNAKVGKERCNIEQ